MVTPVDKIILDTSIESIETINQQINAVSKEMSKYAGDNKDVKILLSITGIDVFSAMLISAEIVDAKRFSTPWKLLIYAGLAPSTRESSEGKTKTGGITNNKTMLAMVKMMDICSMCTYRYNI